MKTFFKKNHTAVYLVLTGLVSGFVNGLLGNGGGIITVFALSSLTDTSGESRRDVFATALAVMLPVSALSAISYAKNGHAASATFAHFALPAALGGLIGAFLLDRIKLPFLKKLFAALVIWSGAYMIFF